MKANSLLDEFALPWAELCRRAPANVFMSPAALQAVQATSFARIKVLHAWLDGASPPRLIGFWALRQASLTPLGPAFLAAPPYNYAFISNPVLDPAYEDVAMSQMLDAIEQDHHLPKVMRLRYLDADCPTYAALARALDARGARMLQVSTHERPVARNREEATKASGATRKKLRQKWRRLGTLGQVEVVNDPAPAAVQQAFEVFLKMEHASWKGEAGTSLLSQQGDAAFTRELIRALAQDGSASVALLMVDQRPIAAQVLLRCGSVAYTWKTAFCTDFGSVSPGALLVDKVGEQLFSGATTSIESCSPEGSFLNHLWPERRTTVELVVHLGLNKSIDYRAVAAGALGYAQLRGLRDRLREMAPSMLRGRGASVANNR